MKKIVVFVIILICCIYACNNGEENSYCNKRSSFDVEKVKDVPNGMPNVVMASQEELHDFLLRLEECGIRSFQRSNDLLLARLLEKPANPEAEPDIPKDTIEKPHVIEKTLESSGQYIKVEFSFLKVGKEIKVKVLDLGSNASVESKSASWNQDKDKIFYDITVVYSSGLYGAFSVSVDDNKNGRIDPWETYVVTQPRGRVKRVRFFGDFVLD